MSRTVQPDWGEIFKQAFTRKQARRVAERYRKERERETQEAIARYRKTNPVREDDTTYRP